MVIKKKINEKKENKKIKKKKIEKKKMKKYKVEKKCLERMGTPFKQPKASKRKTSNWGNPF